MMIGSVAPERVVLLLKAKAWSVLLTALVLFLGLALLIFSTREYVPRDDGD